MAFTYKRPVDNCGDGNNRGTSPYPDGRHWQSFPVLYSLDVIGEYTFTKNTPEEVHDAMRNCFEYINDILGFEAFRLTENPDNAKIKCVFGDLGGTTRGRCSSNFSRTTKKMNRSTILMDNSNRNWFISPTPKCSGGGSYHDIANVFQHEILHAIGIQHNTVNSKATIASGAPAGSTYRRTLTKNEIDVIRKLYAKWVKEPGQPTPTPTPEPVEPTPVPEPPQPEPTPEETKIDYIYAFLAKKFPDFISP